MADPLSRDRRKELLAPGATLNGIDFVEIVTDDEKTLRVHFFNEVALQGTIAAGSPTITGGETISNVTVNPINDATDWTTDADGNILLTLTVPAPGDFSFYTLTIASPTLDEFFNHAVFSFKARCPSDFDCETPLPPCPPLPDDAPPIDYLAKDFLSFRKALLDFSALRYPEWQERSEADFGVMFVEALCSLADDLSYTQDRVAAESTLQTATQRRSIVRHARLVDYEPRPATVARVYVQFDVSAATTSIAAGVRVNAQGADNVPIPFETGTGLTDATVYQVNSKWNRGIKPYFRDDREKCLRAGSTEMWVERDDLDFFAGQLLLIDTQAQNSADPPIREIVRVTNSVKDSDPLFGNPTPPTPLTHIFWGAEDALKFDHDISLDALGKCRTTLAGNLLPATQGARLSESFAIGSPPPASPQMPLAITRQGPNSVPPGTIVPLHQYTLSQTPLAWLGPEQADARPTPEIRLLDTEANEEWHWRRQLLNAAELEAAFTVDPAKLSGIAYKGDGTVSSFDYDGDNGDTIRFGDDVFGAIPDGGTTFEVTYRIGVGAAGNVAADSIRNFDPASAPGVIAVTNPFAAEGGADAESNQSVLRLAPQEFRARQFRAVLPFDYEQAAERLPWVSNAGTAFRWTGSWLTVFTTVDPRATEIISLNEHIELINLLNRYRLAGYESYAPSPLFASLDLKIKVCAQPEAFRGDVEAAILSALSTQSFIDGTKGFFSPDNFTFGSGLERSALEAAIQSVPGVAGVRGITYRQRGLQSTYITLPDIVPVGTNQILRVDNDPSRPEAGSIKVEVEGGK
jgi:hypothetical protein